MSHRVAVVGLGYVGLPLSVAFAQQYSVIGFDINGERIAELKQGYDVTGEVFRETLMESTANICFTTDKNDIGDCNIYIVTVPTPIDSTLKPDLTPLINSSQLVGSVLSPKDIVIYESTVYPGVTEEICVPELERASGLQFNRDFYCGYSPERVNPGDRSRPLTSIVKVTSGSTPEIASTVDNLYRSILDCETFLASSIKVAEASKVIENTQRDVNIALINELALIFKTMNIDTHEVLEAAATKWNFIKLSPGLVGGHCIGVDPYYLSYKSEELGYKPNLILASRQINNSIGKYIAEQTVKQLILAEKKVKYSKVLILGLTFKEDCPDIRNTKIVDIIEELKTYQVHVDVFDPWVKNIEKSKWYKHGVIADPFQRESLTYDAIIVAVAHSQFKQYRMEDYQRISTNPLVIMDIKNIVPHPTWNF